MSHEIQNETISPYQFVNQELFSKGKSPDRNEDATGFNETSIVLSDGATDKTGQIFEGRTGGEIAAELVVDVCLRSPANSTELVAEATDALKTLYATLNPAALEDSAFRFAATLLAARVVEDKLVVTQVGEAPFRINGTDIYTNNKLVDDLTAGARKHYIEATGDVAGSRDFILPLLKMQHTYQNNPDSPLGYGVIDGTPVPEKFVKTYVFPLNAVQTIELASDGYYSVFPPGTDIASYEALHDHIEEVDPHKCKHYSSTKLSDDRTVIIAQVQAQHL